MYCPLTGKQPDPKVGAVQKALRKRNPFYSGMCAIPDNQRHLFYTHNGLHRRVDVSDARSEDLDALYRACNSTGENFASCRRHEMMDPASFATSFDPHSLGIHESVSRALLAHGYDTTMHMELCGLDIHGKGDAPKRSMDRIQQGQNRFGSLVVVFPTALEGGQFVLHKAKTEWTIDFASHVLTTAQPSVYVAAFDGDLEHAFLPVTAGYRVMLTYALFHTPIHPSVSESIHTRQLQDALVHLVNDPSTLPNGGYLGFGLVHPYAQTRQDLVGGVTRQLKGLDRVLMDACTALGLHCAVRLLYRTLPMCAEVDIHLLTTEVLDVPDTLLHDAIEPEFLSRAVRGLTVDQVEGVVFVGQATVSMEDMAEAIQSRLVEYRDSDNLKKPRFLEPFYKTPITEVMEMTQMWSSCVDVRSPFLLRDEPDLLEYFYGTACMVVAVEPAASRRAL